jgi:hypothetical protein
MLLNIDADTRDVLIFDGPPYIDQVVRARRQSSAPYLETYPRLKHAEIDEEKYPRMQRLLDWRDYMNAKFEFSFAAHYGVNLYGYLDSGGFDRNWDNNEQLQMGSAMAARAEAVGTTMRSVALNGIAAVVSPRRYIIELADGKHMGYGALQVPADGKLVHESPRRIKDLSERAFKREIDYEVRRIGERGITKFMAKYMHDNPDASRAHAIDFAFEKVSALVHEERIDTQNTDSMHRTVVRALADFADHVEDLKEQTT